VGGKTRSSWHTLIKKMASLLGGGFPGEGGIPPGTIESVLTRKPWAVLGLFARRGVGSTNDWIGSTNGGLGHTTLALFRGRVGLTEEGTGSVILTFLNGGMRSTNGETGSTTLALFRGRVGLTKEGTGLVSLTFLNGGMGSADGETESTTLASLF
jgi:hypothetical protein